MNERHSMLLLCCLSIVCFAEEPWETQSTSPVLIKTRARSGSAVKEVWAEAELDGSPLELQRVITDVTHLTSFMPYMTDSRFVGGVDADGARYTYAKIEPPLLSARDFIHKVYLDRDAEHDAEGVFANHWFAAPTRLPTRASTVRLTVSEGGWVVKPLAGGRSHVVYRLCVDPAGSIPAFAANRANVSGLTATFHNIEREAQRRREATRASRP